MPKSLTKETVILVDYASNISRVIDSATANRLIARGLVQIGASMRDPNDINQIKTYVYRYG